MVLSEFVSTKSSLTYAALIVLLVAALGLPGCSSKDQRGDVAAEEPATEEVLADDAETVPAPVETSEEQQIGQFLDSFMNTQLVVTPYLPETKGYDTERVLLWAYTYLRRYEPGACEDADTRIEGSTAGYQDAPDKRGSSGLCNGTWYTASVDRAAVEGLVRQMLGFDLPLEGYQGRRFWEHRGRLYTVVEPHIDDYVRYAHVDSVKQLEGDRADIAFTYFTAYAQGDIDASWYLLDVDEAERAMAEALGTRADRSSGHAVIQQRDTGDYALVSLVMDGSDEVVTIEDCLAGRDDSEKVEYWSRYAGVGETIETDGVVIELPDTWTDRVEWETTYYKGGYPVTTIYLKGMAHDGVLLSVCEGDRDLLWEPGDISTYVFLWGSNDQRSIVCRAPNWGWLLPTSNGGEGMTEGESANYEAILELMTAGHVSLRDLKAASDKMEAVNTYLANNFAHIWFSHHITLKEPELVVTTVS